MRALACSSLHRVAQYSLCVLILSVVIAGFGTARAGEPKIAPVTFRLVLEKRAVDGGDTGTVKVVLATTPEANVRRVQGWRYTICPVGVDVVNVRRGRDLENACAEGDIPRCEVGFRDGLITTNVLLADSPSQGILEINLDQWEDLIITYRCPGLSCDVSGLWFCPQEVDDVDQYATFFIGGEEFWAGEGGHRRLILCNAAERLSVTPALKQNGDVGIYLQAAPDVSSCLITGWTYAVCFDGDLDVVELTDRDDYSGEDTLAVRNGGPPKYNLVKYLPGEGIVRSVVVDFTQPIGIDAPGLSEGFEDLVVRFETYPCGTLRICSGEIGDPKVLAFWNNAKEDSLDLVPEGRGSLELCWQRGDANFDGRLNVGDAVNVLTCLFIPSSGTFCECFRDTEKLCSGPFNINGDTRWNVADAVYLLNALFLEGPPVPPLR